MMILKPTSTIPAIRIGKLTEGAAALLILLFVYTALNKWLEFPQFVEEMKNQAIPGWLASSLVWTIPAGELLTAALLLSKRSRLWGFWFSFLLMLVFTAYIALVLTGYFGRTPCSCGGVIRALGWKSHLLFNIFFLLLSVFGLYTAYRERRMLGTA